MHAKPWKKSLSMAIVFMAIFGLTSLTIQDGGYADTERTGTANPAAVYCLDMGYEYKFTETESGVTGTCIFPDGSTCDEWEFLNGQCGKEFSYCTQHGYTSVTKTDGRNPYSIEYEVCVSPEGDEVGPTTTLAQVEESAMKAYSIEEKSNEGTMPETIGEDDFSEIAAEPPDSFDWRNRPEGNYLTSVKNQGQCGSCWAFSAVAASEAAMNIANHKTGNNFDLSEQYLVSDCLKSHNCTGGNKTTALSYIKNSGIPDESCLTYIDGDEINGCGYDGENEQCKNNCTYNSKTACSDCQCSDRCTDWKSRLVKIKTVVKVSSLVDKRKAIKNAIVNKGPVSASIYMNGVFNNGIYSCVNDKEDTNHAVVIVGYNNTDNAWIVRNSWGSGWQDNGYFKVGYGECNIESSVYYPTTISNGPVLLAPKSTVDDLYPTFSWNELNQSTKYKINAYRGSTLLYSRTEDAATICNGGLCTLKSTKKFTPGNYTWKAQGYVDGKWSFWSSTATFNISTSFASDFNKNASGWRVINGSWRISESSYYKTSGVKSRISTIQYYPQKYANFAYEARLMRENAGCSYCANRLLIRGAPKPTFAIGQWSSGYLFQYTNSGSYSVWYQSKNNTYAIKTWTTTSAIRPGNWNILKVIANGNQLHFYINNVLVWSGSDTTLTNGYVGIGMYRDKNVVDAFLVDWATLSVITSPSSVLAENSPEEHQTILEGGDMNISPQ